MREWIVKRKIKNIVSGENWVAVYADKESPMNCSYDPIICFAHVKTQHYNIVNKVEVLDGEEYDEIVGMVNGWPSRIEYCDDSENFIAYNKEGSPISDTIKEDIKTYINEQESKTKK